MRTNRTARTSKRLPRRKSSSPKYAPHPYGAYWCPIAQDFTDPPRPKNLKNKKLSPLHRLKDGGPLCNSKRARWYAYPDEKPTCERCIELSQVTQS